MLQKMGPQSPVLFEKTGLQISPHPGPQHSDSKTQPLSPLDSLVQFQLLQTNQLLASQKIGLARNLHRLDRSISEPYGVQDFTSKGKSSQQSGRSILNPNRYKTEMCRPYVENGYCKYGDKCQFAHGTQEQRAVARHPKYKTEYCKTFHTNGICPYGPRCHFIHNEDENKLGEISQMKRHQAAVQATQEMAKQAAQIQLQHQLLQSQLQALVSQFSQQLISQMSPTAAATQPLSVQRPRLTHSISVQPTMRAYSLGSTADTPPESLSTSPILSPTFTQSEDSVSDCLSDTISGILTPPVSGDLNSSFSFPAGEMSPLQMSPQRQSANSLQDTTSSIASLSASMQAFALGQNTCPNKEYGSSSAMDISREAATDVESPGARFCERSRLPIFNQIASR